MVNLNFIESCGHNTAKLKKDTRVMLILIGICVAGMLFAQLFYDDYTQDAIRVETKVRIKVGWPANVFAVCSWGAIAFSLFFMLSYFGRDRKNPALGVTADGIFINQQMIRNAFVPWSNIESVTMGGAAGAPELKFKFKDNLAVLKGQFFVYRSLAKASLNSNILAFGKDNNIGDLQKIYQLVEKKLNA